MKGLRIPFFVGFLAALAAWPAAAQVELTKVSDLTEAAVQSEAKELPILLMFSAPDCHYCRQLESEYLEPMLISGDYDNKVLIRKVSMSVGADIVDFDGDRRAVDHIAERYGVTVTPTVVFVGPEGHQLADKLVGYTSPDFYGGYLDRAIDTSLGRLRALAANP